MKQDPQHIQPIIVIILFIASLCVIYWRLALRLAAIAILVLAIYGGVLVADGIRHQTGMHHQSVVHHGRVLGIGTVAGTYCSDRSVMRR